MAKNNDMDDIMGNIISEFGKGSIMRFGDKQDTDVGVVSTGCLSIDNALGIGGVPRGRVIEISGMESAGKTTLAQHIIAEVQKTGGKAAFIDAEHALDPNYARNLGVDVDNLLITQPDSGEQALQILERLVTSGKIDVVVVDSVAALVPQKEIDGEIGDTHMALQARMMSQALRKLTPLISKSNTIVIFINQIRMKIGIVFGNPEVTSGGNSLKFYASVRIDMRRSAQIKQGTDVIGNRVKLKITKNKVAPPFTMCEFDIMYNEGISIAGDLLEFGTLKGVIKKAGNTFSYNGERIGVGKDSAKQGLRDRPDMMKEIRDEILEKIKKEKEGIVDDEKDADVRE